MQQKTALDILKMGENVFLTGPAGSGKTFVLNQYIKYLKQKEISVAITASTGIAATHLNGQTIHSWSGLGVKDQLTEKDLARMKKKFFYRRRFSKTKVLVIDEISMLSAHQLDLIDKICRFFKYPMLPFGGLQVILCGDFFQLPPISRGNQKAQFATEATAWDELNPKICYLNEQHRQEDQSMLEILNAIRADQVDAKILKSILSRKNQEIKKNKVRPTRLFTHNANVDAINQQELGKIKGKSLNYKMYSDGNEALTGMLKRSCLTPEELVLKKGAMVMFVKNNFEKGYVNGTLGKIVDFEKTRLPVVETFNGETITAGPEIWSIEEDDKVLAFISQIPLRLAWAITVHKSQGMTLDAAEIDLAKSFEYGMGYVALSRVRSLQGIKLLGLNETALAVDPQISKLDKILKDMSRKNSQQFLRLNLLTRRQKRREFLKRVK